MNNIRDLLREADPLRIESEPSAADRSIQRQAIVKATTNSVLSPTESRSRVPVYISVMLIAIVAFAVGYGLWSPFINDVQAAVRFEIRLVEENPAPGLQEVKVADGTFYLHNDVVVTNSDIAQAKVLPQPGGSIFWVSVTFTPAGARKMHSATEKNIGKRMAILIDGEVISAPVVRDVLNESAVINGNITKEEAERIVKGITIQ
ncbi:MAG: hypothetical protein JXA82_16355 [Sedimentisphaerales bacterium]|nr:hypothetical protein [Sedimentisphaerales bacterium]